MNFGIIVILHVFCDRDVTETQIEIHYERFTNHLLRSYTNISNTQCGGIRHSRSGLCWLGMLYLPCPVATSAVTSKGELSRLTVTTMTDLSITQIRDASNLRE